MEGHESLVALQAEINNTQSRNQSALNNIVGDDEHTVSTAIYDLDLFCYVVQRRIKQLKASKDDLSFQMTLLASAISHYKGSVKKLKEEMEYIANINKENKNKEFIGVDMKSIDELSDTVKESRETILDNMMVLSAGLEKDDTSKVFQEIWKNIKEKIENKQAYFFASNQLNEQLLQNERSAIKREDEQQIDLYQNYKGPVLTKYDQIAKERQFYSTKWQGRDSAPQSLNGIINSFSFALRREIRQTVTASPNQTIFEFDITDKDDLYISSDQNKILIKRIPDNQFVLHYGYGRLVTPDLGKLSDDIIFETQKTKNIAAYFDLNQNMQTLSTEELMKKTSLQVQNELCMVSNGYKEFARSELKTVIERANEGLSKLNTDITNLINEISDENKEEEVNTDNVKQKIAEFNNELTKMNSLIISNDIKDMEQASTVINDRLDKLEEASNDYSKAVDLHKNKFDSAMKELNDFHQEKKKRGQTELERSKEELRAFKVDKRNKQNEINKLQETIKNEESTIINGLWKFASLLNKDWQKEPSENENKLNTLNQEMSIIDQNIDLLKITVEFIPSVFQSDIESAFNQRQKEQKQALGQDIEQEKRKFKQAIQSSDIKQDESLPEDITISTHQITRNEAAKKHKQIYSNK